MTHLKADSMGNAGRTQALAGLLLLVVRAPLPTHLLTVISKMVQSRPAQHNTACALRAIISGGTTCSRCYRSCDLLEKSCHVVYFLS